MRSDSRMSDVTFASRVTDADVMADADDQYDHDVELESTAGKCSAVCYSTASELTGRC
jgi:hypothetical protein